MPIHGYPGGVISSTAPTIAPTGASGVWTTETQLQNSANWPSADYITRSLRFNSADSAYLSWTPGTTATSSRKLTYSCWVKRSTLGAYQHFGLTAAVSGSSRDAIRFTNTDTINIYFNEAGSYDLYTSAVFRDPSAWYHIVVAVDTTQATASNRVRLYVNNVEQTLTGTQPIQNYDFTGWLVSGKAQNIGRNTSGSFYFDGYETEIYCIDGQQLTPSSFGATDPNTGEWQPQVYHGAYGTNGFFLRFANNTNTTSTTLGLDSSGNGNNWTPNNFSVTAGAGNDSLVDSPSSYGTDTGAGGEVRGNYATLNVLNTNGSNTFSNGNLDVTVAAGATSVAIGTIGVTSGQWYWEVTFTGGANAMIGISDVSAAITSQNWTTVNTWSYYSSNGDKYNNSTATGYGSSYTTNDVIGIALNMDAGTLVFYKNGVSQGTAFSTGIAGKTIVPNLGNGAGGTTQSYVCNFGQRPFAYTVPAGFKCLVDTNLPTPTIGATATTRANNYFNTVLWTGTGASLNVTGVGFQPDFVWNKSRSNAQDHRVFDVLRGTSNALFTNSTLGDYTESGITSFNSDGFTIGSAGNTNGYTYVSWNWKANGAGVSNTAGSITSTVSVNTTSGFSIVTYTGNATAGATVGHGLNVAPKFVILKSRSVATSWYVWSTGLTSAEYEIYLNLTDAEFNGAFSFLYDAAPTATTFSLPTAGYGSNNSGATYVAYCFAPIAGYSAFGKYTGNGSADGPFIYTGFRPRYVLMKCTSAASQWLVVDTARSTYNVIGDAQLYPNSSSAQGGGGWGNYMDIVSNGFKLRGFDNDNFNSSADTYIYAAFAEFPFKFARAR